MTNEKISLLYDRVLNNIKFNNNIQNTLVNNALENKQEWADKIIDNIYYGCKFTPGTGGYSASDSPYTILYDNETETQATIDIDYIVLPDATYNTCSCVYITNSTNAYKIIFNINGFVDFYCCGAGGGGGLGAIVPINDYSTYYGGGGGGGAGGNVIKKSANISNIINNVFFVKLGKGGSGANTNGGKATSGGATTITGNSKTTATGGGPGENGTEKIGGSGGINEMTQPTGYGAVGGYNEYCYNDNQKGPSNGQWGYNINMSSPNIYVSGGGSGGGGANYFDPRKIDTSGAGEGGTGGLGGGGGSGGGIAQTSKAGGLGEYLNTNKDPNKHGVDGTKSFVSNGGTDGEDDGINYIITPGNGADGIYCAGGGGSGSAVGYYGSRIYRTTKSTDIRGGNGGDGLVCFRTPR